jgi:hypothetical protein
LRPAPTDHQFHFTERTGKGKIMEERRPTPEAEARLSEAIWGDEGVPTYPQPSIASQASAERADGGILDGIVTTRIELPSGGWAEIGDPRQIRAKHRKRLMDRLNMDRMQERTMGIGFDLIESLILLMVDKWSIPYAPLQDSPSPLATVTLIGELEIPDYDALTEALEPARQMLFPDPVTVDDHNKPGSPTLPAGDLSHS